MKFQFSGTFLRRGFVIATVFWMLALGSASAAFKFIQEGMTPPNFNGKDLRTGEKVDWRPGSSGEGSEVMIIVFWATWSPRSMEVLTDMKELSERYGEQGFKVIAVNVDGQKTSPMGMKEIAEKTAELDLPFPVVVDEGLKTFYAYGVIAVPSLALVDGSGHLRYSPSGYSFSIRDRIVDSTEVLLGLKTVEDLGPLVQGYRPQPKASRYYNLGRRLANQELYERALANLDQAVEEDASFSSPHNLKGQIQLAMGHWAEAEANFTKAVELDSTLVAAWAGWGRSLLRQDRIAEAVEKLHVAHDLDEGYTPALVDLAKCRTLEGNLDEAWTHYEAALELNPGDPELLLGIGRFLRDKGDIPGALEVYRRAIEQLVTLPVLESASTH